MRIAIQGVAGSYHDEAAHKWFGNSAEIVAKKTFADALTCLRNGGAEYAVIATRNSTVGDIEESQKLIRESPFGLISTIALPIRHQLIALKGATLEDITTVYSHPVALPQCSKFLSMKLPEARLTSYFDTAASVGLIKDLGDKHNAAIANRRAAEIYGLPILVEDIQNNKDNVTYFAVLTMHPEAVHHPAHQEVSYF